MAGVGGEKEARKAEISPSRVWCSSWCGRVALEMMATSSSGLRPPAISSEAISTRCFTAMYMTITGDAVAIADQSTFAGSAPVASCPVRKITE